MFFGFAEKFEVDEYLLLISRILFNHVLDGEDFSDELSNVALKVILTFFFSFCFLLLLPIDR